MSYHHSSFSVYNILNYKPILLTVLLVGAFQFIQALLKSIVLGGHVPNAVMKCLHVVIGIILVVKLIQHYIGNDHNMQVDEAFIRLGVLPLLVSILLESTAINPNNEMNQPPRADTIKFETTITNH